jgi:hypothetical protein
LPFRLLTGEDIRLGPQPEVGVFPRIPCLTTL